MYGYCIEMCIYCTYGTYTCTLQVGMSTSGIVICYIGKGCLSHNPRKYTLLIGWFVCDLCTFNLCDFVQEHKAWCKMRPSYILQ